MRGKLQGHGERRENKKLLLAVLLVVLLAAASPLTPLQRGWRGELGVLLAELNRPVENPWTASNVTGNDGLSGGKLLAVKEGEMPVMPAQPVMAAELPVMATVTAQAANVRSGPGLDYAARYWLYAGQRVIVTGCVTGWARVGEGWVWAGLLDGEVCDD